MNHINTKVKTLAFSVLLILTIALPLLTMQSANAHTPAWTVPRYAYVTAAPNPVGPGQPVAIVAWVDVPPPSAGGANGDRWTGFAIDVTKPDGTVIHVMQNGVSDPVGSTYALYTPDQAGSYQIKFSFPDQVAQLVGYTGLTGSQSTYINDTFLAASTTANFTVTATPIQYFQEAQFPVSYWTRPINENNQQWSAIASAWLGVRVFGATYDKFQPYGWAPNTAHVSMTYPLLWGGIVGGDNAIANGMSFYSGTQYNLKFSYPIIMYGNVYFSVPANPANSGNGIACVDLRTGQLKWTRPDISSVSIGQLYDGETPNQHGVSGMYLWYSGSITGTNVPITNPTAAQLALTTHTFTSADADTVQVSNVAGTFNTSASAGTFTWCAVDPLTGLNALNETNVPGNPGLLTSAGFPSTLTLGPQGEWLVYGLSRTNPSSPYTTLWQWNNTKTPGIEGGTGISAWTPGTRNYNMSASYDWNVTLDQPLANTFSLVGAFGGFGLAGGLNATTGVYTLYPQIMYVAPGDLILGQSSGLQTIPGTSAAIFGTPDPYVVWAINLNATRGPIGHVLFQTPYSAPSGNKTVQLGPLDAQNNVFMIWYRETLQWSGYSALTGKLLWGPLEPQNVWNYYSGTTGLTNPIAVGYGHLYTAGYSGTLYAMNTLNGHIDFTFGNSLTDPNNSTITTETVYGDYPTQVAAVANNKIYMVEEEHSLNAPAYHGAKTRCVDAFNGKLLWDIYGICSWQSNAVADGYYTWLNYNDMQIYAMGPGPSATTVDIKDDVVSLGSNVLIKGTVTDQTPQKQLFGTPAVSDADQSAQMEYLIQHSIDAPNVHGVPVQLTAYDSSGKATKIGIATSDGNGIFHMLWAPPATGEYTVVANFTGSQAYGPSSAATAVGVVSAPSPIVTPTPVVTPTATVAPTASPSASATTAPSPSGLPTSTIYAIAAALVIIVVVAIAAIALRRRK